MSEHNSLLCGGQLHDNLFLILSQLSSTLPSWYLTVHSSATNMTKGWSKWQSVFAVAHGNRQLHKQNSYRCMCILSSNTNLCLYTLYIYIMYIDISLYYLTIYTCTCSYFVYAVACYHVPQQKQIAILTILLSCLLQMSVQLSTKMVMWRKVGWEWGKDCHVVVLHIVMNCVHSSSWIWNNKMSVVVKIP